jgi:Uma2 family endonuclease
MTYTSYQYLQFQSRREFENELYERFGSLVKMPLLKSDRWAIFFVLFLSLALDKILEMMKYLFNLLSLEK